MSIKFFLLSIHPYPSPLLVILYSMYMRWRQLIVLHHLQYTVHGTCYAPMFSMCCGIACSTSIKKITIFHGFLQHSFVLTHLTYPVEFVWFVILCIHPVVSLQRYSSGRHCLRRCRVKHKPSALSAFPAPDSTIQLSLCPPDFAGKQRCCARVMIA